MIKETAHLFSHDATHIDEAARLLRAGELVVYPTDTVYGLGCDVWNEAAILQLYAAKKRPLHKAIPVLLADMADMDKVVQSISPLAQQYIDNFWPGPLTLILPKRADLPAALSPNEHVAVRVPDSAVARQLFRAAGGAVATTSANQSGQPPATTGTAALAALTGMVAAVLDDGPSPELVASTILDCSGERPKLLRQGPIRAADLGL